MSATPNTAPNLEYGIAPSGYRLPGATRVGTVRLATGNLDRTVQFYESVLGLVLTATPDGATLHARSVDAEPLLEFVHSPGLKSVPRAGQLGLYHVAIRVPDRQALGRFVAHLRASKVQFGAGDHLVSEAIYLTDPNGFGLEVYVDRPRDTWESANGELVMGTERVNLSELLRAAGEPVPFSGLPGGTVIGHMHLQVDDLNTAASFFHEAVGLDKVVWSYPGALFLSAGGYHHHLGLNTWGRGAIIAGEDEARLLAWSLVLPSQDELARAEQAMSSAGITAARAATGINLVDPWGVTLRLSA